MTTIVVSMRSTNQTLTPQSTTRTDLGNSPFSEALDALHLFWQTSCKVPAWRHCLRLPTASDPPVHYGPTVEQTSTYWRDQSQRTLQYHRDNLKLLLDSMTQRHETKYKLRVRVKTQHPNTRWMLEYHSFCPPPFHRKLQAISGSQWRIAGAVRGQVIFATVGFARAKPSLGASTRKIDK